MNKILFVLISLIFSCSLLANAQKGKLVIKGNIEDLGTDTLFLNFTSEAGVKQDYILAKKGKFTYKGEIDGFTSITIDPKYVANIGDRFSPVPEAKLTIYAQPGDVLKMKGKRLSFIIDYTIKGNSINDDFVEVAHKTADLRDEEAVINYEHRREHNTKGGGMFSPGSRTVEQAAAIKAIIDEFVKANPNSYYTMTQMALAKDKNKLTSYYNKLDKSILLPYFDKMLNNRLLSFDLGHKGAIVPNIMASDIEGKSFSMANLKGKYVVIDFWGTW